MSHGPNPVDDRGANNTCCYTRYIDQTLCFEQLFDLPADSGQVINLAKKKIESAKLLIYLRHHCDQLAADIGAIP